MTDWKEERRKWAKKYGIKGIEFLLGQELLPEHVERYNDDIIHGSDTGDYKRENFGKFYVLGWDGQKKTIAQLTPEELMDWKQQLEEFDFDSAVRDFQESLVKYKFSNKDFFER